MVDWRGLIGSAGTIVAIVCGIIALLQTKKKDTRDDGAMDAEMRTRLVYLSAGMDEMKVDLRAIRDSASEQNTRITRVEESVKQAHKRLDTLGAGRAPE